MHHLPRSLAIGSSVLVGALVLAPAARAQVVLTRIVAVVDDEAIFSTDLEREAAPFLARAWRASASARAHAEALVYAQTLDVLVNELLIRQHAERLGVHVSDADVEDAIETMGVASGLLRAAFWSAVRAQGFASPDAFRRDIREQLLQYRVLNLCVRGRVSVTEREVRDVYDSMVARGDAPPPSFEDAHDDLYRELLSDRMEAAQVQFIAELRRRATIEIRL